MISKLIWIVGILFVAVVGLLTRGYYRSAALEWELFNRVPTYSVEDSKRLGIYVTNLTFSPADLDLVDTRYKIEEVWVEHRTDVERINFFTVRQKNLPELFLCLRMRVVGHNRAFAESSISVSTALAKQTYGAPFSGNMCLEIGEAIPTSILISSDVRDLGVRIVLKKSD